MIFSQLFMSFDVFYKCELVSLLSVHLELVAAPKVFSCSK